MASGTGITLMPTAFLRCLLVLQLVPVAALLQDVRPASVPDPLGAEPARPASVLRLYRASCLKCHDTDGKGEAVRDTMPRVPDFTDAAWHATRSDADLSRSIVEGKGKSMPAMRGKLGSVDVGQLVAFVRAFRGGKQVVDDEENPAEPPRSTAPAPATGPGSSAIEAPRPDPKDLAGREGGRTFLRTCAACHGSDGRGGEMRGSLPSIPDFTASGWQEVRNNPQLIASVLEGRGTGMPPFRDKLSRDQVRELVAFIRSLGPSQARATRTASDDFDARFQQLLAEFEDLRRRSRALSDESAPVRKSQAEPSLPPPTRQARRNEPQSRGDGRRETGG
jgi:mono/diheme cytochrome c family protein